MSGLKESLKLKTIGKNIKPLLKKTIPNKRKEKSQWKSFRRRDKEQNQRSKARLRIFSSLKGTKSQ
jgi:hypothetical protein